MIELWLSKLPRQRLIELLKKQLTPKPTVSSKKPARKPMPKQKPSVRKKNSRKLQPTPLNWQLKSNKLKLNSKSPSLRPLRSSRLHSRLRWPPKRRQESKSRRKKKRRRRDSLPRRWPRKLLLRKPERRQRKRNLDSRPKPKPLRLPSRPSRKPKKRRREDLRRRRTRKPCPSLRPKMSF